MMSRATVALIAVALFLPTAPVRARQVVDATQLQAQHRAAVESIKSLSCQVSFRIRVLDPGTKAWKERESSSRFWYTPAALRCEVKDGPATLDYVWRDSERRVVQKNSDNVGEVVTASRDSLADRHLNRNDALIRGLLVLNVPGTIVHLPFAQLYQRAERASKPYATTRKSKKCVGIDLHFDKKSSSGSWSLRAYFDPSMNHLIRCVEYEGKLDTGTILRREEVVDVVEPVPGVYFPSKIIGTSSSDGTETVQQQAIITAIEINRELPSQSLELRYPRGTILTDHIRHVRYAVDTNGNAISGTTPLDDAPTPPPAAESASRSGTGRPRAESTDEEPATPRWLLPASMLVLAVALVLAIARARRGVRNRRAT